MDHGEYLADEAHVMEQGQPAGADGSVARASTGNDPGQIVQQVAMRDLHAPGAAC